MAEAVLREIRGLTREHTNPHVEAWKAEGRPVVGYFCPYMPPELIIAVGGLPLRLRGAGSSDSSRGDALMSGRICTYVRHVVSLALDGRYDFLDGAICLNTCDHVRRAADVFAKKTSIGFQGFLSVPRNPRESLYGYYRRELSRLYEAMAEHLGARVDDDALRRAIREMNGLRRRLHRLDRLRIEDRPRISGTDALAVHIAAQVLPPIEARRLLDRLLEALDDHPGLDSPRGRLMLLGAELDEPGFIEAIESQGALVVADRLCFGARSVLDTIAEDTDDPLDAIGRAYFFRSSCARMIGDFDIRYAEAQALARRARTDGMIFERLVFCDPWGGDQHNLLHRARAEGGLPVLILSREYGIVPTGQLKTRVQAFLEQIAIARAQRRAAGLAEEQAERAGDGR